MEVLLCSVTTDIFKNVIVSGQISWQSYKLRTLKILHTKNLLIRGHSWHCCSLKWISFLKRISFYARIFWIKCAQMLIFGLDLNFFKSGFISHSSLQFYILATGELLLPIKKCKHNLFWWLEKHFKSNVFIYFRKQTWLLIWHILNDVIYA